tara:strand:- start:408 stop:854 length:447 start_codon:yes stop_codon:yes gene_type:complete
MKKILLIFIFLLSQCGYQPIFVNENINNMEFYKITHNGDAEINRKILGSLSFKENKLKDTLNSLLINSSFEVIETSKNSKGQVESYKSKIFLNLIISNKKRIITNKNFVKEFSYNVKKNKFELVRYQNEIKGNLIDKIIEDIILYISL